MGQLIAQGSGFNCGFSISVSHKTEDIPKTNFVFAGAFFVPKTKFCVGGRPGGSVSADRSGDGKKHFWAFGGPEIVDFFALKARGLCGNGRAGGSISRFATPVWMTRAANPDNWHRGDRQPKPRRPPT